MSEDSDHHRGSSMAAIILKAMLDEKSFPIDAWIFSKPFGPVFKGTGEATETLR
jgi:hypothetical protein